jgi:asparagine synthase (glutamine-hydrolysing)
VAQALGTDHHELTVEPRGAKALPLLAWHLDEPFADSSALPSYYVARAARERVTVALSGDGGDEVFAGYEWRYGLNLLEGRVRRLLPQRLRHAILGPLASAWPKADRLPRSLRWKFFLRNLSLEEEQAYFQDMSLFTTADKRELFSEGFQRTLGGYDPSAAFTRHFERVKGADRLNQLLYVDLKTWLPNDILVKMDRMAMANSLEVRSPLLDHKVMEFAATLPAEMKYRGGTSKYLLKRYAAQHVPATAVERPKMGFSIPLGAWLRGDLRSQAEDLILSERALGRGYFHPAAVAAMWKRHQRGRRDHARHLWALMMLEVWHRLFIDQTPSPVPPEVDG